MANFFKRLFEPKPRIIEDATLGTLRLVDTEWQFQVLVDGKAVEASIPDVNGNPCASAKRIAEDSVTVVSSLWKRTVNFTSAELAPLNPRFGVEPDDFELEGISFYALKSFEGGEVVFWFDIAGDQNGGYFVPLHLGVPLLWHRDS